MKKFLSLLISVVIVLQLFALPICAASNLPSKLEAEAYLVYDLTTCESLLEVNVDERMYPASLTKMVTGILAIENMKLDSTVPLKADAEVSKVKGSALGLKAGEEILVWDALNAMLVASCNDIAVLLAKAMAGSVENFAVMMNDELERMGAVSSHFVNPHGLHDDNHYTTARDVARIAMYCMQNETFREIVKQASYTVPKTNKCSKERVMETTNSLIADTKTMMYVYNDKVSTYYEGTIGIKTGNTPEAGGCLCAAAEKNGTTFLTVVMKSSPLGRFADTHKLLNWAFSNFKTVKTAAEGTELGYVPVKHGEFNKVRAIVLKDLYRTLPAEASTSIITTEAVFDEDVKAPIAAGDKIGTFIVYESGNPVDSCNIVAASAVEKGGFLSLFGVEDSTAKKIVIVTSVLVVLIVGGLATWIIMMRRKAKRIKAERAARRAAKRAQEAQKRAMWDTMYEENKRREFEDR